MARMPADVPFRLLLVGRLQGPRAETALLDTLQTVSKALSLPLDLYDAHSAEAGPLILGFGILEVPTLLVLHHGRKIAEFTDHKDLSTKALLERLPKLFTKHDVDSASRHPR